MLTGAARGAELIGIRLPSVSKVQGLHCNQDQQMGRASADAALPVSLFLLLRCAPAASIIMYRPRERLGIARCGVRPPEGAGEAPLGADGPLGEAPDLRLAHLLVGTADARGDSGSKAW
jgi:hypothetical protein